MAKTVIYYAHPKRFVDRITDVALKLGLIETDGYYEVTHDVTNEKMAELVCVRGSGLVTSFLYWATKFRGKDYKEVDVEYI